jgi:hypothetical protein
MCCLCPPYGDKFDLVRRNLNKIDEQVTLNYWADNTYYGPIYRGSCAACGWVPAKLISP